MLELALRHSTTNVGMAAGLQRKTSCCREGGDMAGSRLADGPVAGHLSQPLVPISSW